MTDAELTAKSRERPHVCPYCERADVQSEKYDATSREVVETVRCGACGRAWLLVFGLVRAARL